jgi:hypothetical protein
MHVQAGNSRTSGISNSISLSRSFNMLASKFVVSAAVAVAVVGAVGYAYAQSNTQTNQESPMGTSANTSDGTATAKPADPKMLKSGSTDNSTMANERNAQQDRN